MNVVYICLISGSIFPKTKLTLLLNQNQSWKKAFEDFLHTQAKLLLEKKKTNRLAAERFLNGNMGRWLMMCIKNRYVTEMIQWHKYFRSLKLLNFSIFDVKWTVELHLLVEDEHSVLQNRAKFKTVTVNTWIRNLFSSLMQSGKHIYLFGKT